MKSIKIGLDIHGVIDKDPELFSLLTNQLRKRGNEIHIITGRELCEEVYDTLARLNINYNQIFSITSYHKMVGTKISYKNDDPTQPIIDTILWDGTKAKYAKAKGLHMHIDDSFDYGKYFTDTQYILYTPAVKELLTTFWEMLPSYY